MPGVVPCSRGSSVVNGDDESELLWLSNGVIPCTLHGNQPHLVRSLKTAPNGPGRFYTLLVSLYPVTMCQKH